MSQDPLIIEGKPIEEEQKQLIKLFHELEKGQIDILEQSGKRIIELVTGLSGLLFAITAFGNDFPPPYLKNNQAAQLLIILCLIFLLSAMFMAMRILQPSKYRLYRHNITEMKDELDKIIANKSLALLWAGILFWISILFLALLVIAIILHA